jgi:crotonobetainyl-CoA:carnitine CoA-transferase CaiB-like acyl-CoA transferase
VFAVADGHVIIAAGNDAQFSRLCTILGRDDLGTDPNYASNQMRLENRGELIPILSGEVAKWDRDKLLAAMEEAKIPGGAINNVEDVFATDQVAAREMKINMQHPKAGRDGVDLIGNPVKFSKTKVNYRRPPPTCGEHTDEILAELKAWEAED